MTSALHVVPVPGPGAEDVVIATGGAHAGSCYTGTEGGSVWRIAPNGGTVTRLAHTRGRPLGIELLDDGDLLVCDAHRGLLTVSTATGAVGELGNEVGGVPMRFCNNAAVAPDGRVFFTDSSRHFGIERWKDDFVQDTRSGRLLQREPDGTVTTLVDGLAFANGVALAADASYVTVAQTRSRTLTRYWLTGEKANTREDYVTDLPGYPDNIARGSDGLVWVGVASPRDPVVETLGRAPLAVRRMVTKIPDPLQPQPKRTVRVQAFDDDGRLVHDLDLPADGFHMVTGVREHDGRVWLGSLHEPAVAFVTL